MIDTRVYERGVEKISYLIQLVLKEVQTKTPLTIKLIEAFEVT